MNRKFDRFRQWGRERMGGEAKTSLSDDFKAMETEMNVKHDGELRPVCRFDWRTDVLPQASTASTSPWFPTSSPSRSATKAMTRRRLCQSLMLVAV